MLERLLFASLQGLIALVGVGAICFCLRKIPAGVKVWLWRLAMLKMAVALCFPAPTLRILPVQRVARVEQPTPAPASVPAEGTGAELEWRFVPGPSSLTTTSASAASNSAVVTAEVPPTPKAPARRVAAPVPSLWLVVWLLGAGLMCSVALVALAMARRTARQTEPVQDEDAQASAREAATKVGLRRQPALRSFQDAGSPFVTGLLRPLVAVPEALLQNLRELRLTLLHEFAHLRRGDLRWSFAMNLMRGLFWFHPLAWIAEREHRVQSEIACDAFVVRSGEDRRDYALALVRMAVAGGPHRGTALLGAVGSRRALLRRLNEMSKPTSRSLKLRTALAIGLPAAVLLIPIQLAARAPQYAPESDPSVPLVVPAITADNLDDITLPALEKLPPPSPKELKAKIELIRSAPLESQNDVDRQLVALVSLEKTQMKDLSSEQKEEVEKALQEAIRELHKALNDELPRAMAEAEKARAQGAKGPDAKALREQIERSVQAALEAAQRALRKVHRGGMMTPSQPMDAQGRAEMEKALRDMPKVNIDEKEFMKLKDMDFSNLKFDENARKEMEKAFEQMKDMKMDFSKLKMDNKAFEELRKNGAMDAKALEELRAAARADRDDARKEMEQARVEMRALSGNGRVVIAEGPGQHQLMWDGKGDLIYNGKKLHIQGGKIFDEDGKEVPNIRIMNMDRLPRLPLFKVAPGKAGEALKYSAPRGDALHGLTKDQKNWVYTMPDGSAKTYGFTNDGKSWVYTIPKGEEKAHGLTKDGKTWTYTTPPRSLYAPDVKVLREGQMPPAIERQLELKPGQNAKTWTYTMPALPKGAWSGPEAGAPYVVTPVIPNGPGVYQFSAPDAKALKLFYGDRKKLSKEQRDRLRKIDAEIQKLMRERQRLSPGYYIAPPRAAAGDDLSPSTDSFLRNNYPGLFPPRPESPRGEVTPPDAVDLKSA